HPRTPVPPLFPYTTLFRSQSHESRWREGQFRKAAGPKALSVEQFRKFLENVPEPFRTVCIFRDASHEESVGLFEIFLLKFRAALDRKSTRLNSSHVAISYA